MNLDILKNDINDLYYKIEHSSSKSIKRYYTNILINLIDILNDIEGNFSEIHVSNIEFLTKNIRQYQICQKNEVSSVEYRNFIEQLSKNSLRQLKPYQELVYTKENFSISHAKEMIYDFFNNFDYKLYPIIKNSLADEHLFILYNKQRNTDGYSYFNTYSNNPYIVVYRGDIFSIENIFCLVHEIGHIINFDYVKTNPSLYRKLIYSNLLEVSSTTFELLFSDYLISNKIAFEDTIKAVNNVFYQFKRYLEDLKIINKIVHEIPLSDEIDVYYFIDLLRKKGICIDEYFNYNMFNNILLSYGYVFGYSIAFNYLSKYKLDKEQTKSNIYEFMRNILSYDDLYMCNNFGLNLEEVKCATKVKSEVLEHQKQIKSLKLF